MAGLGVHGTVDEREALDAAHAAFLAADAGADLVDVAGANLLHDVGVSQSGTAEAHDVAGAVIEAFERGIGVIHATGHDDGDGDVLLHDPGERAIRGLLHVHGRMVPPPGVVGARVDIEGIIAVFLEQLGCGDALLDVAAPLLELLTGKRALAEVLDHALEAEAHGHGIVLAAGTSNLLADLAGKAQAVLEAAAVLVGTVVEERDRELINEVALVDGVDLDAVEAGALRVEGTLAEAGYDSVDLVHRERSAHLVDPAVRDGRCRDGRELA